MLLALLSMLVATAHAQGALPCVDVSPLGNFATVHRALRLATSLPRASAARHGTELARDACREIPDPGGECPQFDVARCRDALCSLYDALSQATRDDDAITRNFSRVVRAQVSDALSRLSWTAAGNTGDARRAESVSTRIPASIQVIGDGRTLRIRPLRSLRARRRYQLVVTGLPRDRIAHWYAGSGSTAGAKLQDDLGQAYDSVFAGESVQFHADEARALLTRVATDADRTMDVPATAGILMSLHEALDGAALSRVRAWFEPATASVEGGFAIAFRTLDPLAGLLAYRTFLAGSACVDADRGIPLEPFKAGISDASLAGVFRGRYRSLDLQGKDETQDVLGVAPGDARATELPFLLAVPKGFSDATPIVLTVHGHGGTAEAMLKAHAIGLARRGMATLAIDLPAHGERSREAPFIDPLRPERSALGIRQATLDALAVFQAATRCGFALPKDVTLRPRSLRYFGYSLGAGVGVLLRAVEKRLGTTVLVAPPGNLVDWQVQQIPKNLGATTYTICKDGPAHGRTCLGPGDCRDGVCTFDPRLLLLGDLFDFPYDVALGGADPVAFAGERTGDASVAPVLLIAGGVDMTVGPLAGPRLASLYGMKLDAHGGRRSMAQRFVYWSDLGHDLISNAVVREQAYDFLMSGGRGWQARRDTGH